jgi:hypothetical protein
MVLPKSTSDEVACGSHRGAGGVDLGVRAPNALGLKKRHCVGGGQLGQAQSAAPRQQAAMLFHNARAEASRHQHFGLNQPPQAGNITHNASAAGETQSWSFVARASPSP